MARAVISTENTLADRLLARRVLRTPAIISAFRAIDRADFVPCAIRRMAYVDEALPIGFGQTISQPYTVAFMLELLAPKAGEHILDIGSGSGWTTALLAAIAGSRGEVYGVEIVSELVAFGRNNIAKYELPQAKIVQADAHALGLPSRAPFDRILVSAACSFLPEELVAQLVIGGVMVLPVRDAIWQVTRVPSGKAAQTGMVIRKFEGFAFVPLRR